MRAPRTAKPHYLPPNHGAWSPDSVLSFDTETVETEDGDDLILSPRCWALAHRLRHDIDPRQPVLLRRQGESMGELAGTISERAQVAKETWVYAHNLGFDLSVSQLPLRLTQLGWSLDDCMLSSESCWWSLRMPPHKIILTDSWTWLRCSLADAAKDLHKRKRPLPANDAPLTEWLKRCQVDADLLDLAITSLMDWWDANDLGRWQVTGSGCGWAAMRHRVDTRKLVVGYESGRTELERSAIYGGRKEVYFVGKRTGTVVADCDFQTAYTRIAAFLPLPERPGKVFSGQPASDMTTQAPGWDYLADVEVVTDTPCLPVRIGDGIWWPVGRFRTVVPGPDIRYALSLGAHVEVKGGRWYKMGYTLKPWAEWAISLSTAPAGETPPLVRRLVKHWGRSVLGRFASRSSGVTSTRPADTWKWQLTTGTDSDTGRPLDVLTMDGVEYSIAHDLEAQDAFPALWAWVESYCRVALGQVMDKRPQAQLLQCNTDGWMEAGVTRSVARAARDGWAPWPHVVVRKGTYAEVVVLGPNHLLTDHAPRLSGVSKSATIGDDGKWLWHDWPSLRWQLEQGAEGNYRRPAREAVIEGPYVRRWVLESGETVPVTTTVDEHGQTVLEPWERTWGRWNDDVLAPVQTAELEPLRGDGRPPAVIFDGVLARGRRDVPRSWEIAALLTETNRRRTHRL